MCETKIYTTSSSTSSPNLILKCVPKSRDIQSSEIKGCGLPMGELLRGCVCVCVLHMCVCARVCACVVRVCVCVDVFVFVRLLLDNPNLRCICVCVWVGGRGSGVTPVVYLLLFSGECSSSHTPPHTHQAQKESPTIKVATTH